MNYYSFNEGTKEYKGTRAAQIDPETSKTEGRTVYLGYAMDETDIEVIPEKSGFARCFTDGAWAYIEDHRNELIYNTTDKNEAVMGTLGAIPDGYTTLKPATIYDNWNGSAWVMDEAAKKAAEEESLINAEIQRLNYEEKRATAIANLQAQGLLT